MEARINPQSYAENDPRHHTARIRQMLGEAVRHLREDTRKIDDPSAACLFETSAEVLQGLDMAFEHFERRAEEAWRK